jgi:hypothetical protein
MAWVNKETVTKVREALKPLNKKYGMKTTVSGTNSSSLNVRIVSGKIDLIGNYVNKINKEKTMRDYEAVTAYLKDSRYVQVNHYWLDTAYSDEALEYLQEVKKIMSIDHWDESDIQTDYFHCAYYMHMNIGAWDKGYELVA